MDESERPTPPSLPDRVDDPHLEPHLDPEVAERVRVVLADAADTGPMPTEVSDRIAAALPDEARLRVGRGPLPDAVEAPVADMAGLGASVVPLEHRRKQRPLPDLAAESPSLGPIATPMGLSSCLEARARRSRRRQRRPRDVRGQAGRIIVVTRGGTSTAYVVGRSRAPGNVTALAGATPVP